MSTRNAVAPAIALLSTLLSATSADARWISADRYFLENPAACIQSPIECNNVYSYALNNPVNLTDPTGQYVDTMGHEFMGPPAPMAGQFQTIEQYQEFRADAVQSVAGPVEVLSGAAGSAGVGVAAVRGATAVGRAAATQGLVAAIKGTVRRAVSSIKSFLGVGGHGPKTGTFPDRIFKSKAPNQVTPGTGTRTGQHINNKGRVEPWQAHYDGYGRLQGRTDFNAGNKSQGISDTHHHTYEWGPGKTPQESGSHLPGEYRR